jgi:hypothetical protein
LPLSVLKIVPPLPEKIEVVTLEPLGKQRKEYIPPCGIWVAPRPSERARLSAVALAKAEASQPPCTYD